MRKRENENGPSIGGWTRSPQRLLLSVCVWSLMGCQISTPLSSERSPIPPSLTQECPPLQLLDDGHMGTVLRWAVETVKEYGRCQRNHHGLIEAVTPRKKGTGR